MRVLYLHQYFNTPEMAGGTRSYEMGRRLAALGHEVHVLTSWREPSEHSGWFVTEEAGMQVHWLPVPYSNHMGFRERVHAFLRFAAGCARRAASIPADVVLATSTPLTIALPGRYAAARQRIPMVFEVRDLWPDVPIAMGVLSNPLLVWLARRLERLAYRGAARVVALAPGMKETVVARGVPADYVTVIPNGCDFDIFGDDAAAAPTLRTEGEGCTIVYLGTMGVANGVEYVPRLAAALERHGAPMPVRFYLVGDGGRRAEAEAEARRLGVLDRSVFFLGALPKREAATWLKRADASIMTYAGPEIVYRDSVSNKFFDSLAAGKPVLANFAGYSTLTAEAAGAGFILSADAGAAAEQLSCIIRDPEALAAAGAEARRLAVSRFSRDELAGQLAAVLESAVAEAGTDAEARR